MTADNWGSLFSEHLFSRRTFVKGLSGLFAAGAAPPGLLKFPRPRWPAEWETHAGCLMSWPHRLGFYGPLLKPLQSQYAEVARTVAEFEPVLLVAHPGHVQEARDACGSTVTVVPCPLNDAWMRDNGPIFVRAPFLDEPLGLDFGFNAWGEPNWEYELDDAVPPKVCEFLGLPSFTIPFVLEGGAITTDGQRTLITTEECLLDPSRNGNVTKTQVETALRKTLGIEKTIWLPWGLCDDDLTDGHVDGVLAYLEPGMVLLQAADESDPPDVRLRAAANREALEGATDAAGRMIEIVDWPFLSYARMLGFEALHTYVNFYKANGAVIVPLAGSDEDITALEALQTIFPEREVIGVRTPALTFAGGGIHCITQQVPK